MTVTSEAWGLNTYKLNPPFFFLTSLIICAQFRRLHISLLVCSVCRNRGSAAPLYQCSAGMHNAYSIKIYVKEKTYLQVFNVKFGSYRLGLNFPALPLRVLVIWIHCNRDEFKLDLLLCTFLWGGMTNAPSIKSAFLSKATDDGLRDIKSRFKKSEFRCRIETWL